MEITLSLEMFLLVNVIVLLLGIVWGVSLGRPVIMR